MNIISYISLLDLCLAIVLITFFYAVHKQHRKVKTIVKTKRKAVVEHAGKNFVAEKDPPSYPIDMIKGAEMSFIYEQPNLLLFREITAESLRMHLADCSIGEAKESSVLYVNVLQTPEGPEVLVTINPIEGTIYKSNGEKICKN